MGDQQFQQPDSPGVDAVGSPRDTRALMVWVAAFVVALGLYGGTANRGPQWQDSGRQQLRIVTGELEHSRGLALAHPVQYFLGRMAIRLPISEPAFAITLVSSLAGALAVANLALTVVLLTRSTAAAVISATALMLSHTFWQHATYTESYALVAALLTGEWLCLAAFATTGRSGYLLLVALLNGVGIANHLLAALALPVNAAIIIWAVARGRCSKLSVVAAAALWLLGTSPYTGLVLATIVSSGDAWGALHSALFGAYAERVLNLSLDARQLLLSVGYVTYNFPGLTVPLAILGAYAAFRRRNVHQWLARALLLELLIYAVFVVRYRITDQYMFYFPVYLLLALFAGLGLQRIFMLRARRLQRLIIGMATVTALWTPAIYAGTCAFSRSRGLMASLVKNKPYRDGYRAFFVPWGRGADYPAELNEAVRQLVGADGVVLVGDDMIEAAVRYAQVRASIPQSVDVVRVWRRATPERVAALRATLERAVGDGRLVVLVPSDRDNPWTYVPEARWARVGDIYRLVTLEWSTTRPVESGA